MQIWIRVKIKAEIKRTHRFKTENGGYVDIVLKNAQVDAVKDARKDLAPTMGQRVGPSAD